MKTSAGLLVYRIRDSRLEVLLGHMGTPWWARKDKGAWSIPKGEYHQPEEPLAAAKREFSEELGLEVPPGEPIDLGVVKQKNNKQVMAWAIEADLDLSHAKSNTTSIEWPPRSGKFQDFPELDKVKYLAAQTTQDKLIAGQYQFIERLAEHLKLPPQPAEPVQNSLF